MATLETIVNEFAKQVGKDIGNLNNLTTTNKTNLVGSINEVIGAMSSIISMDEDLTINFVDIYNTAKTL